MAMNGIKEKGEDTAKHLSRIIVHLLGHVSEKRMIQLTYLGEKLTHDPYIKRIIAGLRGYLQRPDHPAVRLWRRVCEYLPVEKQASLFQSLFHNALIVGRKKREEFARENGFPSPLIMILSPTYQCNLRCEGCYALGYQRIPGMSFDTANRLMNELEDMGTYLVTILGGEPLLWPPLFDLIRAHPNIFFQIYTNGTLMDKEKAKRFSELGNIIVVISIEGNEEETDRWRGKGVYRKLMNAFECLSREHVLIGTSSTVTSRNVDYVSSEEFIDFLIKSGSFVHNYFLYIPANGKADLSLMVSPEQRDLLRRRVLMMRNTKPIFIIDFWNDGPYVEGCIAAGRSYFHVNANGDVEPCVYTHIATHNIYSCTLKEALKSPLFCGIRKRQPHNKNHLLPCMIIDNPHVMREIIDEFHPRFTHKGAEEIYTILKEDMDAYAARYAKLAEKIWEEEYLSKKREVEIPSFWGEKSPTEGFLSIQ
jgi:MoaA/NifB/PqqE/SkfB family radical SAM enzyme